MVSTLVLIVALRLLLGESSDYDERQTADQGMAAKYALWTFLGYAVAWILYGMEEREPLLSTELILLLGCVVVLMVYLTIVILRDAYVPANFSGFHWLLLVIGAVGFLGFFWRSVQGLDGTAESLMAWVSLGCGIVMTWSGLLMLGKRVMQRFEKGNDDG